MTNQDFQNAVVAGVVANMPFKPIAIYDDDNDTIEFLASNESYKSQRIDSLFTVYLGRDSGQIVGALLSGVSKFVQDVMQQLPGFAVEIHDNRIKLVHLFRLRRWSKRLAEHVLTCSYEQLEKLEKAAEDNDVEAEIGDPVKA